RRGGPAGAGLPEPVAAHGGEPGVALRVRLRRPVRGVGDGGRHLAAVGAAPAVGQSGRGHRTIAQDGARALVQNGRPMISLPLTAALALATTPKVGDAAPDFTTQDSDGNNVTLSAMLKDGPIILAFFPKAFTGGCTREMTAYKDKYPEVMKQGARL